jgi:MFS family permease
MTLGQITEIIAMFALARLLTTWRLKWIFVAGLVFGVVRFAICALNAKAWILIGVTLHGCSFTLVFITAQIYVDQRMEPAWRARAQALLTLMVSGAGNLFGYLGTGWWFAVNSGPAGPQWSIFWAGLAGAVTCVLVYFLIAYHGVGKGLKRAKEAKV